MKIESIRTICGSTTTMSDGMVDTDVLVRVRVRGVSHQDFAAELQRRINDYEESCGLIERWRIERLEGKR